MSQKTTDPGAQMMQFILGKWISKPIHVAAVLAIPDILSEGSKGIDVISQITDTDEDSLYRLMRALSSVGIFAETENRTFINTPLSECLKTGRMRSAALMFHSEWHDKMWDNLMFSIKTGKSAFERIFGEPAFDWLEKNPGEASIFHEANDFKAAHTHRVIVDEYDFGDVSAIIDVGGGLGGLVAQILGAYPAMRGVVADRPGVVERLPSIIEKHDLEDRMSAVECDFFKEIPSGGDAYLLSNVLHDWPDDRCITILENCREAMRPGNRLLIVEAIVPEGNNFSISKLLDIEVLLMGGGRERTESEFRFLLEAAGLRLTTIIPTSGGISVIEAVPAQSYS